MAEVEPEHSLQNLVGNENFQVTVRRLWLFFFFNDL